VNSLENELLVQILRKDSNIKDKSYIFEGDKLFIKTSSHLKTEKRFIELVNPWNQLIFCRWFNFLSLVNIRSY
jgi:hypothetical protein